MGLYALGTTWYHELIDTLWNVNQKLVCAFCKKGYELIDTLWNVNALFSVLQAAFGTRINRYIMECKFASASFRNARI